MRFKKGVRIPDGNQGIILAAIVAEQVYKEFGYDFIITSWNDGKHMPTSFHYKNKAFDCRIRHIKTKKGKLDRPKCNLIRDMIALRLPPGFDVVLESNHVHLEHDDRHLS